MDIPSEPYVVGRSFIPNVPSGESKCKMNKDYSYDTSCNNPESDQVFYRWDWGDGTHTGWTGEHASGEIYYYEHTWSERDEYTIRCKAKDVMGEESEWATFDVKIERKSREVQQMLFYRLLEQFPFLQRLLNLL